MHFDFWLERDDLLFSTASRPGHCLASQLACPRGKSMKSPNRLLIGGLLAIGLTSIPLCGAAAGFEFTPIGSAFSDDGGGSIRLKMPATFGVALQCGISLQGQVDGTGVAQVTRVTFSGSTPLCSLITARGLPWNLVAKSTATVYMEHVSFIYPSGPLCGGNTILSSWTPYTQRLLVFNQVVSTGCEVVSMDVKISMLSIEYR